MPLMKSVVLLACLLAPLACAGAPAKAPHAPQEAAASLATRLRTVLDGMENAHSQDFAEAAALVLAETGDPSAFYPLMEEASGAGSAAATLWLVPMELNRLSAAGAQLESDPRAAELRSRVEAAAQKGYRPALVLASNLVGMGIGGKQDAAAATRYLVEGSKLGCQQARAGYLMLSGRLQKGGAKEPAVAAELARNNFYLEEVMGQAAGDTDEGVMWLRRACEHGSALAPYLLTQSRAAALPEQEAMLMLSMAAQRHHVDAMAFLGKLKLRAHELKSNGAPAVQEDVQGGLQLLRMAATLGQPDAASTLATAMAQGLVGEVDASRICALYRMAAEQGEPQGLAGYGYCLMAGRGCTADPARGEQLLLRGVELGALWGNQALASVYFNGLGVKPDMRRAVNALGEDAAMGSVHAYAIMAGITALGNEGAAPDPTRARIYLGMAKEDGDTEAQAVYDAILSSKGWKFFPALW